MSRETEQPTWVDTWAGRIDALGLSAGALFLVEIARAFGFLGSQTLLVAQPLVTGIVGAGTLERVLTLLDDPKLMERLETRLEGEGG